MQQKLFLRLCDQKLQNVLKPRNTHFPTISLTNLTHVE